MQKYHRRIFSSLYWVLSWIKSRSRVRHLGACGQMKHMTIVKDWKAEKGTLNCHYFGSNCLPMTFSARECRKEAWKKTNINMRSQKDFPLSRGKKHFSFSVEPTETLRETFMESVKAFFTAYFLSHKKRLSASLAGYKSLASTQCNNHIYSILYC